MGLEVSKAHFNFLSLIARLGESWRAHQCAGVLAGLFVKRAWHLTRRHVGAAFRLQGAGITVLFASPIQNGAIIVNPSGGVKHFAIRAGIFVLLLVKDKVTAREGADSVSEKALRKATETNLLG